MGAANARIQQGDITSIEAAGIGGPLGEILNPCSLLLDLQSIEKISGHRWRRKGTHGAKSSHGQRDMVPCREADDDDIFRKVQAIGPDLNLIGSGLGDKGFRFTWLKPDFPVRRAIASGKFLLRAAP